MLRYLHFFSWLFGGAEKWLDKNAMVKLASRFQKIRSLKKVKILQFVFVLRVASWKKIIFHGWKKHCFFPYFHYEVIFCYAELFEGAFNSQCALLGLRQFLATESPLKMMENGFYFTSNNLFVLKIFKFLSGHFDHVSKWLD